MTQYKCEKHGIHYGSCAACLKERKESRIQNVISGLKKQVETVSKQRDELLEACNELLAIVKQYEPHTIDCAVQADPEDFGHLGCTCEHGLITKQAEKAIKSVEDSK